MKQVSHLSIIVMLLFTSSIFGQQAQKYSLPNGFLVKFKTGIKSTEIRAKDILKADNGIREGDYFKYLDIWYIEFEPATISKEVVLQTLRNDPEVLRSNIL